MTTETTRTVDEWETLARDLAAPGLETMAETLIGDAWRAAYALGAASRASPEAPTKLHEVPPMHGHPGHDCATMPCYVETHREYAKITAPYRREIDRLRGKLAGRASPEEGRARTPARCGCPCHRSGDLCDECCAGAPASSKEGGR